jgi:glycogen phosphorylase
MNVLSTQKLPKRILGLNDLANNLWWSWNHDARELFKSLDRPLWKATVHNPVRLLREIPPFRLVAATDDPAFIDKYDSVMSSFKEYTSDKQSWVHDKFPQLEKHTIAYFSMEFALHNSIPLYAGGLGVLAGDYCKEASDLGLPMVGVGFMYPQGYFQQRISDEGWQQEVYKQFNFSEAPVSRVLDTEKRPVKITVDLDSGPVVITAWQVNVGRVKLYLLDSDVEENRPAERQLTARLYGGDREARLRQEIVLGIGGVRMLRKLGIEPVIWHANEGHASFMMLERCRELVAKGTDFNEAADTVTNGTVFTTHTPVPAGNDTFEHGLIDKYFGNYWGTLKLSRNAFLELGTQKGDGNKFNMTVLGMNMAARRNGVSELHGAVCRRMWQCLWPETEEKDVPIKSVTNGVHVSTWVAPQMARLYSDYVGKDWLAKHDDPATWEHIGDIPDEEIWNARMWLKNKLISAAQGQTRRRWTENHSSPVPVIAMGALLDADVLTIGFCRRFTGYKRGNLILHDLNRLKKILQNELRPVQIIFAGKAHPNDEHGKHLIQEVFNIARNPEFGGRIAFVEEYNMHMAHFLVSGVDVWLNTPQPLQEASGTSGMKAGLNGVPQLSVLDGWWYEGYNGTNGWAIDGDNGVTDPAEMDRLHANELYHLLEEKIIPLYYDRDLNGVPHRWLQVVKQAIRTTMPMFSARRMVKEYTDRLYLPTIESSHPDRPEMAVAPHP